MRHHFGVKISMSCFRSHISSEGFQGREVLRMMGESCHLYDAGGVAEQEILWLYIPVHQGRRLRVKIGEPARSAHSNSDPLE